MRLTELFSPEELDAELHAGYVKEQKHPTLPLVILNYTDKATYDRRWNNVTMHCRGLIVDEDYLTVIARGPRKFFNYGEPSATQYPLDTQVRLTTKHDGSLGIGWIYDDGEDWRYGVATRGSFSSEQAAHASQLVFGNTTPHYELFADSIDQYADKDTSYIGEIIYPENRIVLDYGTRDELIPLGVVDNKTGLIVWRPNHVLVDSQPAIMTLAEAIALPIPDDEEGYVLDILDEYLNVIDHLKLKGDRYKELHAAIFGLTEARVYEAWIKGESKSFVEALPDEVQPWAKAVARRLYMEAYELWIDVKQALRAVDTVLGEGAPRKKQAKYLLENYKRVSPAVFALLDNNNYKAADWVDKQIKPGHVPFSATKESVSVG